MKIILITFLALIPAAPSLAAEAELPVVIQATPEEPAPGLKQEEGKAIQATRIPRRDTRSKLVCTAADGAPKLADRTGEGSCRSHTKEHQAETTQPVHPWIPRPDPNVITGR